MKKILIVANIISFIEKFNKEIIAYLKDHLHYEVHVACNTEYMNDTDAVFMLEYIDGLKRSGVVLHNTPIARNPFNFTNIDAYRELKGIIDRECFDIIHCHTPVGALLARLAARSARKKGTKVFYTAHGFHFYTGAPLLNWLVYYPVERFLARWTDVLITINKEDYTRAQKFKAGKVVYVPGVGIDVLKFSEPIAEEQRHEIRAGMGVPDDAVLLCSVGELNNNKNHSLVIRALALLENENVHYCIAGEGDCRERLTALSQELGMADRVHLLGYRSDMRELYKSSDIFCFPSLREGLPVSLMEAMASGLPCVASRIRGNVDLAEGSGMFDPLDAEDCKNKLESMIIVGEMSENNDNTAKMMEYSGEKVIAKMSELYFEVTEKATDRWKMQKV